MKQQIRGSILLLTATIIWGSTFVAQSVGMDLIGPFTFQAVRCVMAVAALLILVAVADRFKHDGKTFFSRWRDAKLWKAGILCGIPLFLATNLQQVGLVDTDAGKSAFLTAMYIVIVPLLGIFRRKKPSIMVPISVLLAVAGLYCLSCVGVTAISRADLLLIGCAFMFAVQITFVDMYVDCVDPLRLSFLQTFVCAVLSIAVMLLFEKPAWEPIRQCWLPLCYAGILSMCVAYTLQIVGQKGIEPAAASLIMSLESVFAVLFGCLLLRETLTFWKLWDVYWYLLPWYCPRSPLKPSQKHSFTPPGEMPGGVELFN